MSGNSSHITHLLFSAAGIHPHRITEFAGDIKYIAECKSAARTGHNIAHRRITFM
jgi:hypothetical protein